jgi:anti-sigma-K factor RskA
MPDVVNNQDLHELAAEFVLGTLDSDERARANERLNSDDQFRDLVRAWERRLGELHLMVEPVELPRHLRECYPGRPRNRRLPQHPN